jgi:hypothetical protein
MNNLILFSLNRESRLSGADLQKNDKPEVLDSVKLGDSTFWVAD